MRRIALPVVALLVLSACSDGAARASGAHPHLDALPPLTLEETLRIGDLDDPDLGFSSIGQVRVAPSGEIYVAEGTTREIRAYDATGALLATYGRQGEGPGEFRGIGDFGLVGDTLWVSDGSALRLTLFDVGGALLGTVTGSVEIPIGQVGPMMRNLTLFPSELVPGGRIVGSTGSAIYPNLPDSVVEVPRLLFDMQGNVVDTLEMVRARVSRPAREMRHGSGTTYVYLDPPAHDSGTYVTELDRGSASVHWFVEGEPGRGTLTVSRLGPAGDTTARSDFVYDARPVEPGYLDSVATARTRSRPGMSRGDSLELFRAYRSAMQMPPHHRPIRAYARPAEGGGGAWIAVNDADPAANRWIVVSGDGEVRGLVDLPTGATLRWVGAERVWLVENDAFGVPWLVGYRIR
jgi:hypothetical protein